MRNKRKVVVKLIEKEYVSNQRLVEYLAAKYKEREVKNNV